MSASMQRQMAPEAEKSTSPLRTRAGISSATSRRAASYDVRMAAAATAAMARGSELRRDRRQHRDRDSGRGGAPQDRKATEATADLRTSPGGCVPAGARRKSRRCRARQRH